MRVGHSDTLNRPTLMLGLVPTVIPVHQLEGAICPVCDSASNWMQAVVGLQLTIVSEWATTRPEPLFASHNAVYGE